jgi:hypothetical protein
MRTLSLLRPFSPLLTLAIFAALPLGGGALVGACSPGAFDDLRAEAGVVVAEAPDGYGRSNYGSVLASFGGPLVGVRVSRLAVSADADSQVRVYAAWTGTTVQLDPAMFDVCTHPGDCEASYGSSLAGLTSWRGESLCVVIGAPTSDLLLVSCENSPTHSVERVDGPANSRFGESVVALPSGALLVGAPQGGTGGNGTIFVATDLAGVAEVALPAVSLTGVTRVGTRVAAAGTTGGGALAAITASGSTHRRVIVAELDSANVATLLACLEPDVANPAYGSVVAVGNLVGGDDIPDVVVADDPTQPARREEVRIYDGAELRAAAGACPAAVAPTVVACATMRGVACAGSGFGTSLAIGDVDGDGDGDLAIGAPTATFDGVSNSGVVWLIPGNGLTLEATGADVLTDGEPVSSARLGTSVVMVESRDDRYEIAAGAPGVSEVFVFLCSGLAGDGVSAGPHCIPAAP